MEAITQAGEFAVFLGLDVGKGKHYERGVDPPRPGRNVGDVLCRSSNYADVCHDCAGQRWTEVFKVGIVQGL